MSLVLLLPLLTGLVGADFPFRNTSLTWQERVEDLVGRLTVDEIQTQMGRGGWGPQAGPAPGIPKLGINPYSWNTECLRGDARSGSATSFPQSIGLAASWSTDILFRMAEATGVEVRGKYNDYAKNHVYGDHKGLSCFSPVINIMRDPRWGRNQETYGEDPYLSGQYAANYVKGLQGNDSRYLRANAGCKHFDAHGGPENIPVNRFSFDAKVPERDWRSTFLPAFRTCVKAGTMNLMCSYNRLNGVPACANKHLLTDVLRKQWGFEGYVISDQGAIELMITQHKYFNNYVDLAAGSVDAGCNLELSNNLVKPAFFSIVDAVKQGKLKEDVVRTRAKELFYARMRLGEFDPPSMNPYSNLDSSVVETQAHQDLAVEAAMKTFVLLKNQNNFLPIKANQYKQAAVVGPFTYQGRGVFGSYAPNTEDRYISTVLDGLKGVAPTVKSAEGCTDSVCRTYQANMVKSAVQGAEIVFVCLGLGQKMEDEFRDRPNLDMPSGQVTLLQDVLSNTKNDVPVVLLMFNAGPVNIVQQEADPRISAIMALFYPAQATGTALLKTLTNDGPFSVPAGRLPYTWYRNTNGFPSMTDYSMTNRTYRYSDVDPLYPFGYGLSYTTFQYSNFQLGSNTIQAGDDVSVQARVTNTGGLDADEVVQLYISWESPTVTVPRLQLVGFLRTSVPAKGQVNVNMTISHENLAVWADDTTGWAVQPGKVRVYLGGQQPNQKTSVGSNTLSGELTITGTKTLGVY
ncbi:probable beta-D-xylosidase 2 isoform X1 [Haliotis rubra]|uniref:probable beta-D-xylosidase 2 isoform X1 n=1 Tax=Haliotis rubra TaxID=36100 RepID=UPI001EE62728|nr:probable beta-D-xylosidase 2 isoform X1 [Haliotis rubra]